MSFLPIRDFLLLLTRADLRQWFLLLAAAAASGIARSIFLALINAGIAAGPHWNDLVIFGLGAVIAIAIMLTAEVFGTVRGKEASTRIALRMRGQLLDGLGSSNLQLIESEGVDNLHYHIMNTVAIAAGTYSLLLTFTNGLVTLAFNVAYIGWLSPIGLMTALSIILVGVTVHWQFERFNGNRRSRIEKLNLDCYRSNHSYLLAYKELRLSGAKTADYRARMDGVNAAYLKEAVGEVRLSAYGGMATNLFEYTAIASIGLLLPALIGLKPVIAMQLLAAILFTMSPLVSVVGSFSGFGQVRVAFDRVAKLRNLISGVQEPAVTTGSPALHAFESLSFRDVSFEFDGSDGVPSGNDFRLGPINFTIRRGEILCITGGNGSGKTVLMRILTGLYRPTGGQIVINGMPLETDARQDYREHFSAVFSDFFLFKELLDQHAIAPSKVMALIEYFDLKGKTSFSDGEFETVTLSSGQRKRIALIVSILDQRPIMVLDEFGADQDPAHRRLFYREWLEELRRMGKTVVVVSHDDRYFDAADRIIRLDFGQIVENKALRPAPHGTA